MTTIRGHMQGTTVRGAGAGRRRTARILASAALAIAMAASIGLATPLQKAFADDYPSWQDVQNAIAGVKDNQALQTQVQGQIQDLQAKSAAAQEVSRQKGEIYGRAQDSADQQQIVVQQLQAQVDSAKTQAEAALKQVNGLLAELAKPGGADLTSSLIAHPGDARDLLYRLGTASKLTQTSKDLYARAIADRNTVQKLTDQAAVADTELQRRRDLAMKAFEDAQVAAQAAQEAVLAESTHLEELKAQLVALQQNSMDVQAKYEEGLAKAQAAAGAKVNLKTGWALPAEGPISSGFGMRKSPYNGVYKLHTGTDIAGGCSQPIWAAHAGTVVYAGWYLDLGNFIEIDHGNGYVTGYGHIINGGMLVSQGQQVKAGQQIAKIGSTGGSTGCHLHFMVRTGGMFGPVQDPVPFMRSQGMPLG